MMSVSARSSGTSPFLDSSGSTKEAKIFITSLYQEKREREKKRSLSCECIQEQIELNHLFIKQTAFNCNFRLDVLLGFDAVV